MPSRKVPSWIGLPSLMLVLFALPIPSLLFFLDWMDWISEMRRGAMGPPGRFYDPLSMGCLFGLPAVATSILTERAYSVYLRHRWTRVKTAFILIPAASVLGANLFALNACVDWNNPRILPLRFWLAQFIDYWESGFLYLSSAYGLVVAVLAVSWLIIRYPHEVAGSGEIEGAMSL